VTVTLLATILVTSLAGSLHCLAMCGPLVTMSAGKHSLRFALVHALGRLATYVTLGAFAGLLGRAVDVAGRVGAIQHAATIVAAAVIVGWGLRTIAIARGWIVPSGSSASAFARGLARVRTRRPAVRVWLAGALTGLVPCGWLWAFVVSAAGTGSVLLGAMVMSVFWLGTVPAMTGVLAVAGPLIDRLRRRMPVVTAIALIVLGVGTLASRWNDAGTHGVEHPSCHEAMR
jgi:sulfite exporter TauE/SafE